MSDQVDGSRSTSSIVTEPEDYPRSTTPQSPPRTSQPYTSASPLLKLPLELRQHIYSLVFHDNPTIDDPCWGTWLEKGCQCGGGLSATNCQLYSEVRAMVYRYRRFAFSTPERALFFLTQAGENRVRYIGSFAINWEQKPRSLRKIIDHLTVCTCLHTLCLEACHPYLMGKPDCDIPDVPLVYMPSPPTSRLYDLNMRTCTHPLTQLQHVRSLTVVGVPDTETEEGIFNLLKQMESRALSAGKVLRKTHASHLARFRFASSTSL